MNIKEMIKNKLGNPHYVIDDIEITSSVVEQMATVVKYIMANENKSFDDAFLNFYQSDLFRDLDDVNTKMWLMDPNSLISLYYSDENKKTK